MQSYMWPWFYCFNELWTILIKLKCLAHQLMVLTLLPFFWHFDNIVFKFNFLICLIVDNSFYMNYFCIPGYGCIQQNIRTLPWSVRFTLIFGVHWSNCLWSSIMYPYYSWWLWRSVRIQDRAYIKHTLAHILLVLSSTVLYF